MATEKRLIDANALRKEIDCCDIETFNDKNTIVEQIAQAPTVDAVEVVHGRWITVEGREHLGVRCSNCQKWFDEKTNYCPNCGAKMDGDGDA